MIEPQKITYEQARARLAAADAPTIVDVRTPAEFATGHLAGSVNIPFDLVQQRPDEIARAVRGDALLVCRTDNRAARAAALLAPALRDRVSVVAGGMTGWAEKGGPVESGTGRTWAMERQVRATAGTLAFAAVAASTVAPKAKWIAGGVGVGLLYSGVSDTCAMANVLAKAPWNTAGAPSLEQATRALAAGRR